MFQGMTASFIKVPKETIDLFGKKTLKQVKEGGKGMENGKTIFSLEPQNSSFLVFDYQWISQSLQAQKWLPLGPFLLISKQVQTLSLPPTYNEGMEILFKNKKQLDLIPHYKQFEPLAPIFESGFSIERKKIKKERNVK